MPERLEADFILDTDAASRAIEELRRDIERELSEAIDQIGTDYAQVVGDLPTIQPEVDTASLTSDVTGAVTAADGTEVAVGADATGVTAGIDGAVQAADTEVAVTADADAVTAGIDSAVQAADVQITPTIDTSSAEASLAGLGDSFGGIDGLDVAAEQAQQLDDTLAGLEDQGGQTTDRLGITSNVSTTLATAFSAAKGEGRQLLGSLGQLGGGFGPVIAGAAGATVGFTALFQAGEHSVAAFERVRTVLGGAADQIEHINVGGLSGSLSQLSVQAGVSSSALRNAAASAAQVGLASGASKTAVVEFANNVNALALRAVALNPALGDAGAVSERLNVALARGGRFLNRYGIDLNTTAINTRALADTNKSSVRELTFFERSVAGAELAVQQLGNSMGKDFAKGTEQSSVQIKRLKAELLAAFAAAGRPLVGPTIDALSALTDVATELSAVLGQVGQAALPVLKALFVTLGALAIPLEGIAAVLKVIPQPLLTAVVAFAALRLAIGPITGLLGGVAGEIDALGNAAGRIGAPVSLAGKGLGNLSVAAQENGANFAVAATGLVLFSSALHGMGANVTDTATGIGGLALAGSQIGLIFGEPVLGAAIGAATGGIIALGKSFFDSGESAADFSKRVGELGKEIEGLGKQASAIAFLKQFFKTFEEGGISASSAIDAATKTIRELATQSPAAAARAVAGLRDLGAQAGFSAHEIDLLQKAVDQGTVAYQRHAKNTKDAADTNERFADSATGTTAALQTQNAVLDAANKKLATLADGAKPAADAITELGSTIEKQIAGKVPEIGDAFDAITGAVEKFSGGSISTPDISGFVDSLNKTEDETRNWIDTVHSLFDQGLTGLAALVLQRGPSFTKDLAESIAKGGPEQAQAWNDSITAGIQGAAQAQAEAKALGITLSGKLIEGLQLNPNDLADALGKKVFAAARFAGTIRELLAQGLTGIAAQLLAIGEEGAQGYLDGLNSQTPAERAALNQRLVDLQQSNKDINAETAQETVAAAEASGTMGEKQAAAYARGVEPIPQSADEAMLQTQAAITRHGPAMQTAGSIVGAAAEQGVLEHTRSIPSDVGGFIGVIPGVIDAQAPEAYTHGLGYGDAITRGIQYGIAGQAAVDAARAALGGVLGQLDTEAHVYLQASRVSRHFIPFGESIPRGLAVGITNAWDEATGALHEGLSALTVDGGADHAGRNAGGAARRGGAHHDKADRSAAWYPPPTPPAGMQPFQVQVNIDPGMLGQAVDQSIHDIVINNHGNNLDTGASAWTRKMRSYQYLYAGT